MTTKRAKMAAAPRDPTIQEIVATGWKWQPMDEPAPPPQLNTQRTWGEAAGDTGLSVMSGLAGIAKTGGDLYGLASGDMSNAVSEASKSAQEYWTDKQSPALKTKISARQLAIDQADGVLGKFGAAVGQTITDPALMADTVFSNVATMVPGMAAGRVAQGVLTARALAASGGTLSAAAAKAVAMETAKVATGVAVGVGAVQQGADVSSQAYDDSVKKFDTTEKIAAQLAANPMFAARVQAGEAPRDVAQSLGLSAARAAFLPATAISVATSAIPGGTMLERALIGGAARDTIKAGTKYALPKAIIKGGLGEAGQETLEEGGGKIAANVAKQRIVDPNQNLGEGVGENAGMGFVGGLGMGATAGALHRAAKLAPEVQRPVLPPESPTPATPVPLTPAQEKILLARANFRAQELGEKVKGTKDTKGPDGSLVPGKMAEFLTPEEKDEQAFLKEHGGDVQALAQAYPGLTVGQKQQALDSIADQGAADQRDMRTWARTGPPAAPRQPAEVIGPEPQPIPQPPAFEPDLNTPAAIYEGLNEIEQRNDQTRKLYAPQAGDRLNPKGEPFSNMAAAKIDQKRAGDGFEIVKADRGFVVRPSEPAPMLALPAPAASAAPVSADAARDASIAQAGVAENAPAVEATDAAVQPAGTNETTTRPAATPVEASAPAATDAAAKASLPGTKPTATVEAAGVGERWNAAQPKDRVPVLLSAGWVGGSTGTQAMMAKPWAELTPSQRARVTKAMSTESTPPVVTSAGRAQETPETAQVDAPASDQQVTQPVTQPTPTVAKPNRRTKAVKLKQEQAEAQRADYFTPGNVVKSYGGHDEVVRYNPPDENGRWSVSVRAVVKDGDRWVPAQQGRRDAPERNHSTQPDTKELSTGPVVRAAKNQDQRTAAPVADSLAPGRAADGDGGVATTQAGSAPDPAAAASKPAVPHDPYANNHAAFEGKTVEQQVKVAETGEVATMRMDAAKALREIDAREQSLLKLRSCLKGAK